MSAKTPEEPPRKQNELTIFDFVEAMDQLEGIEARAADQRQKLGLRGPFFWILISMFVLIILVTLSLIIAHAVGLVQIEPSLLQWLGGCALVEVGGIVVAIVKYLTRGR